MGLRKSLGLEWLRSDRKAKVSKPHKQFRSVLSEFCSSLRDKDCIVFGSAPDPVFDYDGEPIVCCNGSALSLKRLTDRRPDYTFMHCHVLARENQSDKDVRDALGQTDDLSRVVIFHDRPYQYTTEFLKPKAAEIAEFDWRQRYEIIESLIGAPLRFLDVSTGAMTAAAVLHVGARSVQLVGFSFERKGHSYNNNARYRNHVRSDAALLALLAQAGHNIFSCEPSVAMILARKID